MTHYRVYRIGDDGHIKGVEHVECGSDEEARAAAINLKRNCSAMEVWSGKRFVTRIDASNLERGGSR